VHVARGAFQAPGQPVTPEAGWPTLGGSASAGFFSGTVLRCAGWMPGRRPRIEGDDAEDRCCVLDQFRLLWWWSSRSMRCCAGTTPVLVGGRRQRLVAQLVMLASAFLRASRSSG
jgi:hypothetical protein